MGMDVEIEKERERKPEEIYMVYSKPKGYTQVERYSPSRNNRGVWKDFFSLLHFMIVFSQRAIRCFREIFFSFKKMCCCCFLSFPFLIYFFFVSLPCSMQWRTKTKRACEFSQRGALLTQSSSNRARIYLLRGCGGGLSNPAEATSTCSYSCDRYSHSKNAAL